MATTQNKGDNDAKPRRQFGLRHLFLEIFWIAAALACFTQFKRLPDDAQALVLLDGWLFSGTAIGGFFGRMPIGFIVALGLLLALGLVLLLVVVIGAAIDLIAH
jgi:hypothetical protein